MPFQSSANWFGYLRDIFETSLLQSLKALKTSSLQITSTIVTIPPTSSNSKQESPYASVCGTSY
jgi:hypothetical protein